MIYRQYYIFAIIVTTLLAFGCANPVRYDAQVNTHATANANHFTSIQSALDAAPANPTKPYIIFIAAGDYYEKLIIDKPNVHLYGEGIDKTRIHFNAYAGQYYTPDTTWGTAGSATLTIRTHNVELHHLTLENSFDFLRNDAMPPAAAERVTGSQAVALFLDNGSDRFIARDVKLLGYQDTLYINSGRSWFDHSVIAGNVDYIFGKGNALFTDSEIKTLARGRATLPHGYVTAPSTHISDFYGFTFINCKLTRNQSVPDNSVPLGRPWHPTTRFADGHYADPKAIGKTVFINTWMDGHITHDGWYAMGGTAKDGSKISFAPEDARFFEFDSHGPGAIINNKRRQLTNVDIKNYTFSKIMGDWQPDSQKRN